jgi:hypothetical protein
MMRKKIDHRTSRLVVTPRIDPGKAVGPCEVRKVS